MYEMSGRTALVTGAALGIGRCIARRLAGEGMNLALFDVNEPGLAAAADEMRSLGVNVATRAVDVSNEAAVEQAVDEVKGELGPIHDLVNNAGISHRNAFLEADSAHFQRVMGVNVWGVYHCSRAVVPMMVEQGCGNIVNLASWAGKTALPHYFAYCTSKFAVIGMTQSMAVDLGEHGIRANAVCPGIIMNTPTRQMAEEEARMRGLPAASERVRSVPARRLGEPEDVANCVAFLLSDEASYLNGQAINVTGGLWMS